MKEKIDDVTNELISKNVNYKVCDLYKSSDKRITNFCRAMNNHTKKYKDYYKNFINSLLQDYKTNLPKEERDKYLPILDIISKYKPEISQKVEDFKRDIDNISYVMNESGKWHPINKLNTNYSDISELLSFMVKKFFGERSSDTFFEKLLNRDNAYEFLKSYDGSNPFISSLKKQYEGNKQLSLDQLLVLSSTATNVINHDFFIKEGLEKVFSKKVKLTIDEIKTFINNTTKNSYEGEVIENIIEGVLEDNGWKIIHKGGNGDFIDMKFGIDLIIEKKGIYRFVQVKKVWDIKFVEETIMRNKKDGGAYMVSGKITDVREDTIDLLAMGTMDGKFIITESQNEVVEYSDDSNEKKYRYTDKKILPAPKTGFCYVDTPFDGIKKIIC
jgi:hypothetical protein